jgi:hypothetical protein
LTNVYPNNNNNNNNKKKKNNKVKSKPLELFELAGKKFPRTREKMNTLHLDFNRTSPHWCPLVVFVSFVAFVPPVFSRFFEN